MKYICDIITINYAVIYIYIIFSARNFLQTRDNKSIYKNIRFANVAYDEISLIFGDKKKCPVSDRCGSPCSCSPCRATDTSLENYSKVAPVVELQSKRARALTRPGRTLKMIMIMTNMLYVHFLVQLDDEHDEHDVFNTGYKLLGYIYKHLFKNGITST